MSSTAARMYFSDAHEGFEDDEEGERGRRGMIFKRDEGSEIDCDSTDDDMNDTSVYKRKRRLC